MKMIKFNYVIFIATHGRPHNQKTLKTLAECGYTGPVYLIVDDLDSSKEEYRQIYGKKVIVFDKKKAAADVDFGDNFDDLSTVLIARSEIQKIAKDLGYQYFCVMDDDYSDFQWVFDSKMNFHNRRSSIKNLDKVFNAIFDFYAETKMKSVAMFQGGDFIGGQNGSPNAKAIMMRRKCMQTFFCSTDREINWVSRLNDDVSTYVVDQTRGNHWGSFNFVQVCQGETQQNSGGLTEVYLNYGTYVKSFYSVMFAPSAVKIKDMGHTNRRLHHFVDYNACTSKIVPEALKKVMGKNE